MSSPTFVQERGATPARTTTTARRNVDVGRLISRILFYILLAIIAVYTLFPFYWAIRSSITPDNQLFTTPVSYWPTHPTWDNYRAIFNGGTFLTALKNSAIISLFVTALALAIGATTAYALGRLKFRGRTPILYMVLGMTLFPGVAILPAVFKAARALHLYNTLTILVLVYMVFTLPFTVWVLSSFFRAMPNELEEAAYVDGATPFQTFWRVMLPLITPAIVTTGLLAFIGAWNEFFFATSLVQTPDKYTVTVAINSFAGKTSSGFDLPWGQLMAATVIVTVPLVVLVLIFQRRILAGMTAGAVKG